MSLYNATRGNLHRIYLMLQLHVVVGLQTKTGAQQVVDACALLEQCIHYRSTRRDHGGLQEVGQWRQHAVHGGPLCK